MKQSSPVPNFDLSGGCLCLNFANTLDKRLSENPEDNLTGYAEFVNFGQQTGVLSLSEARKLTAEGRGDQAEASRLFHEAVTLREIIYRIMSAVAERKEVSEADKDALNAEIQKRNAGSLIAPVPGQLAWRWVEKSSGVDRLIGNIVRSAVEVLTSDDIERVKRCAAGQPRPQPAMVRDANLRQPTESQIVLPEKDRRPEARAYPGEIGLIPTAFRCKR